MKKHFLLRIVSSLTLFSLFCFYGCQHPSVVIPPALEETSQFKNISIADAKVWYEQQVQSKANARVNSKAKFSQRPRWKYAQQTKFNGVDAVIVTFQADTNAPIPRIRENQPKKDRLPEQEDQISVDQFSDLIIYQKGDKKIAEVITKIPDDDFYKQKNKSGWKFSGLLIVSDLDGHPQNGFRFEKGKHKYDISFTEPKSSNGRLRDYPCPLHVIDWYSIVCVGTCSATYDRSEVVWGICVDGGGGGPTGGATGGAGSATSYYDATGGTGRSSVAIVQTDADNPVVDPFQQIKCFRNNTSDYTYELTVYVDQPGEDGGGSSAWFDVGHAFVGLRKVNVHNGEVIQRSFGFYPRDSWAAVGGSGGRLHTNENSPYDVSIRYTLTPQQMTNAANAALNNGTHMYVLTEYNCTDFVKSVCDAAGVSLTPQRDKTRVTGSELWFNSPGKTGQALRNASSSNPNITVRSPIEPLKAPSNLGNCQ